MSGEGTTQRWRRSMRALLASLAPPVLRAIAVCIVWSLRVEYRNDEPVRTRWARGERVILSFWHGQQVLVPLFASSTQLCVMVSHSRDGEMATKILRAWQVVTVRGSASRGAVSGFLRLVRTFRGGANLAVMPDGPRGPRQTVKPGVVHLAKALGAPIYPVGCAADRAIRLRSWDRLMIPLPFARVRVEVGEPIAVTAESDAEQLEASRAAVEAALLTLTGAAEARLGRQSSPAPAHAA